METSTTVTLQLYELVYITTALAGDIVRLERDPRWAELAENERSLRNRLMVEQEKLFNQLLALITKPAEPVNEQPAKYFAECPSCEMAVWSDTPIEFPRDCPECNSEPTAGKDTVYRDHRIRTSRNSFNGKYSAEWKPTDAPEYEALTSQSIFESERDAIIYAKFQINMDSTEEIDW